MSEPGELVAPRSSSPPFECNEKWAFEEDSDMESCDDDHVCTWPQEDATASAVGDLHGSSGKIIAPGAVQELLAVNGVNSAAAPIHQYKNTRRKQVTMGDTAAST